MFTLIQWWCTGWKGQRSTAYSGEWMTSAFLFSRRGVSAVTKSDKSSCCFVDNLCAWPIESFCSLPHPPLSPLTSLCFLPPLTLHLHFYRLIWFLRGCTPESTQHCQSSYILLIFVIKYGPEKAHKYTLGSSHCVALLTYIWNTCLFSMQATHQSCDK